VTRRDMKRKPKSWQYENTVTWQGEKRGVLSAADKPDLEVATPPEFHGHPGIWTPEDLLVASVNCCIMTTFLYFAARTDIAVVRYRSEAEGTVEVKPDGLLFTAVSVRPHVLVASEADREKVQELLERSEKACLISRSMKAVVALEPCVTVTDEEVH